ncbi:MAG: hypothetical protein KDM63_06705 [Verrucomicrobiae bacterium]|nr:hypothetical protein [Verrucomicrobiae bacterium]MCB1092901.1 hypothetical protein [Verrucomicrobiae bacterium]
MNIRGLTGILSASIAVHGYSADVGVPENISAWIETEASFVEGHPLWYAANGYGTVWDVYMAGGAIKVREYRFEEQEVRTIDVPGGQLSCDNRGEWGAKVFWKPVGGDDVELSKHSVRRFFRVSESIFAIAGLAHMATNEGEVLRFSSEGKSWKVTRLCKLVDEPQVVAVENERTFLVLTYSGLSRVSLDGRQELLVVSAPWNGLHPRSLVVGNDGFAYVGFSQRVAKVDLETGDVRFLIPFEGIFEKDLEKMRRTKKKR